MFDFNLMCIETGQYEGCHILEECKPFKEPKAMALKQLLHIRAICLLLSTRPSCLSLSSALNNVLTQGSVIIL